MRIQSAPLGYAAITAAILSACLTLSAPDTAIIASSVSLALLSGAVFYRYQAQNSASRTAARQYNQGAANVRPISPRMAPIPPTSGSTNSQPAKLLGARYRCGTMLGEGGMKRIYLAEDTKLRNRQCAVAELLDNATDPAQQQANQRSFEHEVDLLLELDSPYIPKVYDRISEQNRHYLVIEFFPGATLEKFVLNAGGRLEQKSALNFATQILEALVYLHGRVPPVIFRDLKPDNVMVTPEGHIRLIDFGIARHFTNARGTRIGTPGYAAPEQYKGQVDPRSDVYAFGALMHYMLSGRDPQAEPPFSFPPLATLRRDVDPNLAKLIDQCLNNDANLRPQSALQLLNAIRAIASMRPSGPAPNPLPSAKPQVSFCIQCGKPLPPSGNCPNCGMARYHV
jgi:serine/threonine protein kinase